MSQNNVENENFGQNLKDLIESILNKLSFQVEPEIFEDLSYLQTSQFYIQIYRELFRKLSIDYEEFFNQLEQCREGEALQFLIDKISVDILDISLAHIKGESMINGDMENIFNFLQ